MKPIPKIWWIAGFAVLAIAASLPVARRLSRGDAADRCSLDGAAIEPGLQVRIEVERGAEHRFCSLACAEWWLRASGAQPTGIHVTDEASGKEIAASAAFYARSLVESNAVTRERRHVFLRRRDAEAHVRNHRGRVLTGDDRPFAEFTIKESMSAQD